MSSYREFARGALPAIILALVIVSAVHIYLPTQTEKSSHSNISTTISPSVPSYHASSQIGIKGNYLIAFYIALLIRLLYPQEESFLALFIIASDKAIRINAIIKEPNKRTPATGFERIIAFPAMLIAPIEAVSAIIIVVSDANITCFDIFLTSNN